MRLLLPLALLACLQSQSQALPPQLEGAQGAATSAGKNLKDKELFPFQKISQWRFGAAASYRSLGGVSWKTGSSVNLSDYAPSRAPNGPAGDAKGTDHTYNDGYIHPDTGTGIDGHTAFFGFDNSSQVQGNSILFHGDGGTLDTLSESTPNADGSTNLRGFAPVFQATWLGREFRRGKDVIRAGISADLSLLGTNAERNPLTHVGEWNRYQLDVTDRYSVNTSGLPSAPYHGDDSGLGPVIGATPDKRQTDATLLEHHAYDVVAHQNLDLLLTAISFGPTVEWEHGQRFAVQASMGLALNLASWDASQIETINMDGHAIDSIDHHDSGVRLLPGLFAQVSGKMKLNDKWWLTSFGRYDWCGGIEGDVGPSHFHADLGGWTVGISAERRF